MKVIRTAVVVLLGLSLLSARTAFADDDPDAIQEIVVTAQKREQRLADVGISITALGPEQIKQMDIRESTDIVQFVPGLQFTQFSTGSTVYNIRGVSQVDYGDQQEPPVAVYQDDSYAGSLNLAAFPVFDLQRVEVLRGPQGSLFGRNATGGAIQFISNKPTKDFEANWSMTAGRFNEFDTEGAISGPLGHSVQGRFAYTQNYNSGYLEDVNDGTRRAGARNYAFRGELAAQPTEHLDVLLTARYARNLHENAAGMYSWSAAYPGPHNLGVYVGPNAPNPFGACAGCDAGGYKNAAINPQWGGDPWRVAGTGPANFDRTIRGLSLKLEDHLGPVTVTSVTDFTNAGKQYDEDSDGSPNYLEQYDAGSSLTQLTQEFRVSRNSEVDDWVLGAFYMNMNGHYKAAFTVFPSYFPLATYQQTTRSGAVFGQNEWRFAPTWSLITGARFWADQRKLNLHAQDNLGVVLDVNPSTYPDLSKLTFRRYSAKVELDKKWTDHTLTYISWDKGTKSGGFTVQSTTPPGDPASIQQFVDAIPYKPEILTQVEGGIKTSALNGHLSIDADYFYYNYHDYQGSIAYGIVQTIRNLPAREDGAEIEVNAVPSQGLTVNLGVSALRSRVNQVVLPDGGVASNQLPEAPNWSGHALMRYEIPFSAGTVGFQFNTTYTGRMCFTVLCSPVNVEPGHAVSSARVSYKTRDDHWNFAVIGKNLFSRQYRVFDTDNSFIGGDESVYAPPRWWGIQFGYNMER